VRLASLADRTGIQADPIPSPEFYTALRSATYTLNSSYGAGFVVDGTGVLLNKMPKESDFGCQ